jgi:CRP/FNR family transcriptional regulator
MPQSDFSLPTFLRSLVYFEDISADVIEVLAREAVRQVFASGEVIFIEGDPAAGLRIIEQGSVKIYKLSPEGMEHVLHLLGAGNTFNDIAALDGGANPVNAAALSDVVVWTLPSKALTRAMLDNSRLALNVIHFLAGRVRGLVRQIEDLALYSVVVRLARFLLKQAEDPALSGPGITRVAIAAHLATTPQTISNALRELETSGVIEFDRHRIYIVNEDLLRSIAML